MLHSFFIIGTGAAFGAFLRFTVCGALQPFSAAIPLGTLAVNLTGGYLIGLAAAFFTAHPALSATWGLLVITGFLGSLTTFSAFSLEVTTLLQQRALVSAFGVIALHVLGSLAMTGLGLFTYHTLKG